MHDPHDSHLESEQNEAVPPARLSPKEFARKIRRETYQRFKEKQKTDPVQIERLKNIKAKKREAYQKAKLRQKQFIEAQKKVVEEKTEQEKVLKRRALLKLVAPATDSMFTKE